MDGWMGGSLWHPLFFDWVYFSRTAVCNGDTTDGQFLARRSFKVSFQTNERNISRIRGTKDKAQETTSAHSSSVQEF